jgi:hypothetical protein
MTHARLARNASSAMSGFLRHLQLTAAGTIPSLQENLTVWFQQGTVILILFY